MHKNDQLFILMEDDIKNINCLNVSHDRYLLLVAIESSNKCEISIYNLSKINFNNFSNFTPRRKIISESYKRFFILVLVMMGILWELLLLIKKII